MGQVEELEEHIGKYRGALLEKLKQPAAAAATPKMEPSK